MRGQQPNPEWGALQAYRGRSVLLTGHTGFKGAWLSAWLERLGARVAGYALPPDPDRPSLFDDAGLRTDMDSVYADLLDREQLAATLRRSEPEIVFHLAAQSLVRRSYRDPVETYATNVMGTVHLLEAVRRTASVRAVVVVTSDKCYENRGLERGYREDDPLGGHDPYSSSKACAELVTAAYRLSFLHDGVAVASTRAGNVIGGGDWAEDRLIPDIVRAVRAGDPVILRNPSAIRPWQHVLEPLRGYLMLGLALLDRGAEFAESWNFGPDATDAVTVGELVAGMAARWDRVKPQHQPGRDEPHEAAVLQLDASKAASRLGWVPRLNLAKALDLTTDWYKAYDRNLADVRALLHHQIEEYAMPERVKE